VGEAEVGKDGRPVLAFADQAAWEAWLVEHGTEQPGLWLKLAKKGSGHPSVSVAEAVEAALCHGWIDGQLGRWDEQWYVVRFTPRKPRSVWSKINVTTVERLLAEGRKAPAGLSPAGAIRPSASSGSTVVT